MKKWIYLIAVFTACILEVTLLNDFRVFGVKPNLLLATAVIAGLVFEFRLAVLYGILAGLLKDVFSSSAYNTVMFVFWSIFVLRLNKKLTLESDIVRASLIFIVIFLNSIIIILIHGVLGKTVATGIYLRIIFLEPIYTTLIIFPVFKLTRMYIRR